MRRLYVLPRSVWAGTMKIGEHWDNGIKLYDVMARTVDLFHPDIGSHAIDLPDDMMLMATSFDFKNGEGAEDVFHSHPEVAILPHPTTDGNKKLKDHIGSESHKYTEKHHNAIKGHETLGFTDSDTVVSLHGKAGKIHPELKLRNRL